MISQRKNERGGAQLKFLLVMAFLGATAYAGYLYVPVAFQAYTQRDFMQHCVDVGSAQGYPETWVVGQVQKNAAEFNFPADAVITSQRRENRLELTVQYVKPIEFPGYTYNYEFDHTVKSSAFLTFK
ncbi:MAG TPA: hypothetical protein VLB68_13420 [Pyrinomonadaceae bacterium]|nr:hypothetical protein [Pyrinomonadaceae bacterium]